MSTHSPDESSQDAIYLQPPTFELLASDPLLTTDTASSSPFQPSKNHRVPQPKHSHLPMWAPPWKDTSAISAVNASSSKMVIVHPKSTFLKDDIALNNVYNSSLSNNNAWKCVECLKMFYMKNRLKMHYMLEHDVAYCPVCDIFLETAEEQEGHQQRIHDGKTCDFCYLLIHPTDLIKHHRSEHDVISCPYCFAYIRPSSELNEHIVLTHRPKVSPDDPDAIKLFKQTGRESFRCFLCAENRRKELIGHFNIYHKIHTHVLAQLFVKYKVNLTLFIEGFPEYGPSKDITCEVCEENIPELVPTEFHFIYCRHQFHCVLCSSLFPTVDTFNAHSALLHERHPCKLNCANMAYNSAENLTKHYLAYHRLEVCPFCDEMVSVEAAEEVYGIGGGLQRHVKMVHACLGQYVGGNDGDGRLIEVVTEDDSATVRLSCLLCNDNIPSISPNAIYLHFHNDHSVASYKVLTLIGGNLLTKTAVTDNNIDEVRSLVDSEEADSDNDEVIEDISDKTIPSIFNENFVECLFELNEMTGDLEVKCELCPEEFGSALHYIAHIYSCHNIKLPAKYRKCDKCAFRKGRSKELLLRHFEHYVEVENHRDDDKNFKCNLCDNEICLSEAEQHYSTYHGPKKDLANLKKFSYKCRFCKKAFWNAQTRDQHEIDNHFKDELNKGSFYSCATCKKTFSTPILLRNHTTSCCIENASIPILYHCLECSAVLSSIMDTTKHFEAKHKQYLRYLCLNELCNTSFKDRRSARRHYHTVHVNKKDKTNKEKKAKFLCKICGLSFTNKNSLGGHKHVHTTQKRMVKCMLCPEKFMTKAIRNSHAQIMHLGISRFKCTECDKTFQSRTSLSMHRTTHLPLFKCTYCVKEFSRRDSYKEHLLIHEGPRHQCPHCPRTFTQMSNLRRHLRIHTGEKPYKCPFCDKTFSDIGACKSHTSVHTRDQDCKCDICGKTYSKKQKLRYHMKTHTGKDMHPCHICNKEFVGMYNLRLHLTSHESGAQAAIYLCDLCSKECKTKTSLNKHRKRCKGVIKVKKDIKPKKQKTIRQPGEKRKYVKKNKKLKNPEDDDDDEVYCDPGKYSTKNYEFRESNKLTKLKMANDSVEEFLIENDDSLEEQGRADNHNKDPLSFMDISQMMVTTMETAENENLSKINNSNDDSDEDNISIVKLKRALTEKIHSSNKAMINPCRSFQYNSCMPAQFGKSRRENAIGQHLPNRDIIKPEFLTKLSSAIKSTAPISKSSSKGKIKRRGAHDNIKVESVDQAEEESMMDDVQFVDIKVEPKEEMNEEYE